MGRPLAAMGILALLPSCVEEPGTFSYQPTVSQAIASLGDPCHHPNEEMAPPAEEAARDVPDLIETAILGQSRLSRRAEANLLALGDNLIPLVIQFSGDENRDLETRARALGLLVGLDSPAAAEALLQVCETKESPPLLRVFAVDAVARMEQPWILPRLVLRLKYEKDPAALAWTNIGLARWGNYSGLPYFFIHNDFPSNYWIHVLPGVRAEMETGVRHILRMRGNTEVDGLDRPTLKQEALSLGKQWRQEPSFSPGPPADACLQRKILESVQAMGNWQLRGVDDARFTLEHLGSMTVPALLVGLKDESVYIRSHSLLVLGRLGPLGKAALPAVYQISQNPEHRAEALECLGKIGGQIYFSWVERCLLDPDPNVRVAAAGVFREWKSRRALPGLQRALQRFHEEPDFALMANLALLSCGDKKAYCRLQKLRGNSLVDQDLLEAEMKKAAATLRASGGFPVCGG